MKYRKLARELKDIEINQALAISACISYIFEHKLHLTSAFKEECGTFTVNYIKSFEGKDND